MKFPDLVHAAKPEPHFAMPQAASAHDTFWDFASLMPEITHMLMWAMSDRAIPRSYRTMQGFGVHTYRLVNAAGRVALRQVPLEPDGRDALAGVGRSGQDLRRRSRLPPPRPLGSDRSGRLSRVGAGRADLHRGTGRGFHLRRARRDEDRPGGAGAGVPGRQARPEPQPRQLLRRDRAGRVLRRARRAGHRLHQRSAARRPHPLLRRHPDLAARRRQLPRDPDQRADRAGAQQPARRHAPPGDQPRPRLLRAELARRRLSVPGRQDGLRVVPGAASGRRSQGPRQAGPLRRSLHPGARCSGTARRRSRRRTSSRRSASSCRRCRRRRSASAWCPGC